MNPGLHNSYTFSSADPSDRATNLSSEISTISTSGSGYYLGNGGVPYDAGSPLSLVCLFYYYVRF